MDPSGIFVGERESGDSDGDRHSPAAKGRSGVEDIEEEIVCRFDEARGEDSVDEDNELLPSPEEASGCVCGGGGGGEC